MDQCTKNWAEQMRIEGLPIREIAEKVGVNPSTINRHLSNETVKQKIDYVRNLIAQEAYEKAAKNVVKVIDEYNKAIDPEDKAAMMQKEHGFKASLRVLESMGIMSSAPAHTVNQVFVQNNQQFISPVVDRALEMAMKTPQDVVIDSECDEDNDDK